MPVRGVNLGITDRGSGLILRMAITSDVETHPAVPAPVMGPGVTLVMIRFIKIEMTVIGIRDIYPERPLAPAGIDRTIEIIRLQEPAVLGLVEYIPQIIVPEIQRSIIFLHGPVVSTHHIIHHIPYGIDKVIVDLVYVVVLSIAQVQLIPHLICQETCLFSHLAHTHRGGSCCMPHPCEGHQQKYHLFHTAHYL